MNQPSLFDAHCDLVAKPEPTDPHLSPADTPRLRGQNAAILERLRQGPATNDELAGMARKYTSRISDLRAAGYSIECERRSGGLCIYLLAFQPRQRKGRP